MSAGLLMLLLMYYRGLFYNRENRRIHQSGMQHRNRKDEENRWKIYGWDLAENVNIPKE